MSARLALLESKQRVTSSGEQGAGASVLAAEIAESCAIGDHTTLSRPALRGIVGFGALFVGAVRNLRSSAAPSVVSDTMLIAANPVAHGARLVTAVRESLGESVQVVADTRFAAVEVDRHFPGVSMVSLARETSWRSLRYAFAARRNLPRGTSIPGAKSRLYAEYLFIAQAIRYSLAADAVANVPPRVLVLSDFDRAAYSRPWIWASRQAGLATATLVHGSPNAENYLPFAAEHVFVWGTVQASWVSRNSPQTSVSIVGRADMSSEPAAPGGVARAIVCHSKELLSAGEASRLCQVLIALTAQGKQPVLRLHPSAIASELDERWASVAALCQVVNVGSESLTAHLRADDVVLSVASSSVIDAIAMGVRGVVISDDARPLPADLEAVRLDSGKQVADILAGYEARSSTRDLAQRLVCAQGSAAGDLLCDAVSAVRRQSAA